MGGATIRPGEAWIARTGEAAHLGPRSGRGKTACGLPAIAERYHTPGAERCEDCLRIAGVVVAAPRPDPMAGWTEPEKREAWGK